MTSPEQDPKDTALQRQTLIALNASCDLARESVCRLAQDLSLWLFPSSKQPRRSQTSFARELGLPRSQMRKAFQVCRHATHIAQQEIDAAHRSSATIVTILDSGYPAALRDLDLPPPVLYVRGRIPDQPCIAIVGSRHANSYALEVADQFGYHLAATGVCVISGFARGVDVAAHRGALRAENGRTVAVLGCGLAVDYPRGRTQLVTEVSTLGAIISEFPLDQPPLPRNFPIRNRIIAALSLGTLVVQAVARSGSLITARLALSLGREVYAVPGRIFDHRAIGPNSLIQDGALLAQHPRDILESLSQAAQELLSLLPTERAPAAPSGPTVEGPQGVTLAAISPGDHLSPEDIAEATETTVDKVLGYLLELEVAGWISRHPGPQFSRKI